MSSGSMAPGLDWTWDTQYVWKWWGPWSYLGKLSGQRGNSKCKGQEEGTTNLFFAPGAAGDEIRGQANSEGSQRPTAGRRSHALRQSCCKDWIRTSGFGEGKKRVKYAIWATQKDLEITILTKVSQTEKDKYCINCMWNLKKKKKLYKWTYLQTRNRLTEIENK